MARNPALALIASSSGRDLATDTANKWLNSSQQLAAECRAIKSTCIKINKTTRRRQESLAWEVEIFGDFPGAEGESHHVIDAHFEPANTVVNSTHPTTTTEATGSGNFMCLRHVNCFPLFGIVGCFLPAGWMAGWMAG